MPLLLEFCHEILHHIIVQVHPEDLAALSASCRQLHNYIRHNRLLWKNIYLRHFDCPPENALSQESPGFWEEELKRYIQLRKLLGSENRELKSAKLIPISRTIIHLLERANPNTASSLNHSFLSGSLTLRQNLDLLIFSSSLYEHCGSDDNIPHPTAVGRQLSAKLHCLFGTSRERLGRTRSTVAHPYARSRVYDLRGYTTGTAWGPFVDDGTFTTDWEKVEAVMVVLGFNMELYSQRCAGALDAAWSSQPFAGATPDSYRHTSGAGEAADDIFQDIIWCHEPQAHQYTAATLDSPQPSSPWTKKVARSSAATPPKSHLSFCPQGASSPVEAMDPYGVTGTWRRIVCFLDYSEFHAFNFYDDGTPLPVDAPRCPITAQEAIRLIVMKVRVTKIEEPGPSDGQALPVVHFAGVSRSMHSSWDPNANSKLRGTVRLTPEGEVRWTTLSIFNGEARWRSEGIQVGGLRSARGVVGTWFDKDYDRSGPAGPTAFWKLTDSLAEDVRMHPLPDEFQ